MGMFKGNNTENAGEDGVTQEALYTLGWTASSMKTMGSSTDIPQKLKLELPYNLVLPLLGVYPK
jgi:hypothetical protein